MTKKYYAKQKVKGGKNADNFMRYETMERFEHEKQHLEEHFKDEEENLDDEDYDGTDFDVDKVV